MPTILLIVFDGVRADHVSAYGYDRATMPTLEALAAEGVLWERAYSASSWTKPSVASLLTGLHPSTHGAFQGIKRSKGRHVTTDVVRCAQPTLAESLTSAGWRCGAFINNAQLGVFSGLNRGFEAYDASAGKADRLIGAFWEWFDRDRETPTFAYLHFLEAHYPFKPRRRHVRMFGGDRDTNPFSGYRARDYARLRRAISRGEASLSADDLHQMIQLYDGAIRRLDGKLRDILDAFEARSARDDLALFVTADHGEEFLDHGRIGHGQSLYEELIHVPLVASVQGGLNGVRRADAVSLVDLPDTIRAAAGLSDASVERDLISRNGVTHSVFAELRIRNRYTQSILKDRFKLIRQYKFNPPDNAQLPASPLGCRESLPFDVEIELYDTRRDPREAVNLAADPAHAAVLSSLERELDEWWRQASASAENDDHSEVELDERVVQRLRDLGYIE